MNRKLAAEFLGTALLVYFAVGVATLSFGFGFAGSSISAGVIATALAFGIILLAIAYGLGAISGAHVNPAVTVGVWSAGRMTLAEAAGYWIAQVIGGIVGAALLFFTVSATGMYDKDTMGLGQNGWAEASMTGINLTGALLIEVILTFTFVLVILGVTRKDGWPNTAGIAIGLTLVVVHLIGIPFTGTSVNPARSLGPALFVGGEALTQVWLFLLAPMLGGIIAGVVARLFYPQEETVIAKAAARQ